MAILTINELVNYSNLSATDAASAAVLISVVQERICMMTNNYFLTSLDVQDAVTFNGSARTVVAKSLDYGARNFISGDDIMVYNSHRNDGYFTLDSVSTSTLTVISGQTVVDELSGASVLISVVKWPTAVKQTAALMVEYDYATRPKQAGNVKSHSLGPFSETFSSGDEDQYGYPRKITDALIPYRTARLM
jgi:hypothetical protein